MEQTDVVVIGAGVIGLAVARRLARTGREVLILEAENAIGTQTSARNSEVIHAGLYYPTDSIRAAVCVQGKEMLYRFCAEHGVAHKRLGKLIVATREDEKPLLERFAARARANGVADLQPLSRAEAQALEPALECRAALLSPSTGIIDSHGLMLALEGDAEDAGAVIALNAPVIASALEDDGVCIEVGGASPMPLKARCLINCAGLGAQNIAKNMAGFPAAHVPPLRLAKGNYFTLAGRAPFSRLIYPVPGGGGLGVHLTLDLAGQARFGPDVEWVNKVEYSVDPNRSQSFYAEIRRYWPGLADEALQPGYCGIRPKLHGPNEPQPDFLISGPKQHGIANLVHLFGIESPGLTSSLAIAEQVFSMLAPTRA